MVLLLDQMKNVDNRGVVTSAWRRNGLAKWPLSFYSYCMIVAGKSYPVTRFSVRILLAACVVTTVHAETVDRTGKQSVAVFVGEATDTNFVDSMITPWKNDLENVQVVGVAYNNRFGTLNELTGNGFAPAFGDHLMLEGEVGGSFRFGNEHLGEAWTGLYVRYDGFFWNDKLYTTLAVNTGVSLLSDFSGFERGRDSKRKNAKLLHYMGPEITFSPPDNHNIEFLIRYHHRSGVFGLFDGVVSGSTFLSTGVRYRF